MFTEWFKKRQHKRQLEALLKNDVRVHPDSIIGNNTTIGKGTNINGPAYISSSDRAPVTIGKYCAIAHNLRIRARNHYIGFANLQDKFQHRHDLPSLDSVKGAVVIGNNVWIGDNVIVLSGVVIGDGVVIGAGSIVTKSVANYSVVAGNPARIIKMRFSENISEQLLALKWWDWSEEKITRNKKFFETDLLANPDIELESLLV